MFLRLSQVRLVSKKLSHGLVTKKSSHGCKS